MRWKLIGAGLLVVVGIGAVAFAVVNPSLGGAAATEYLTSQAAVTDVIEEITATGTIEPATTYSLAFGSAPTQVTDSSSGANAATAAADASTWVVETVTAAPGQAVKAGDVLATADAGDAELQVAIAEANLASAKARLASDKGGMTSTEKAAAKLQVTQAQQSVNQARSSYSSTVAQNNLKLSQAKRELSAARRQLSKDRAADAPHAVIVADKKAVQQAQDNLKSLRLQVASSNTQASNQITQASNQLKSAQISYKENLAAADAATLASDRAQVASAEQEVATAKAALQYASLVAPVDGVVVAVNVTPGLAAPASQAITVRSSDFQVAASVTESDLPLLEVGQEATVTVTALDTAATGKVASVDQVATSSSFGVVSYAIVVTLPEAPEGTATGMTAEVAITTQSAADVLAVPAIALDGAADGTYSVQVLDATGQPQSVPVEVGLITTSLAEITSGIEEGTAVVVGTASDRTSSTVTTTRLPGIDAGGGIQGGPGGGFPGQRP